MSLRGTLEERLWRHVIQSETGCWLWTGAVNYKGYGYIRTSHKKNTGVHRLSWAIHNRCSVPNGMQVCHTCDIRLCVNPAHLFLGSASDNTQDMLSKDRHCRGSRQRNAKLHETYINDIKLQRLSGQSMGQIAKRFRVRPATIQAVLSGRTWKHVQ